MSPSKIDPHSIFDVICYGKSGSDSCFIFYSSPNVEDAIQVALNLHRGCNQPHRIQVYDAEAVMSVLNLFSEDYE